MRALTSQIGPFSTCSNFRKILHLAVSIFICVVEVAQTKQAYLDDICGQTNNQKIYLEFGENGSLEAKFDNLMGNSNAAGTNTTQNHRCSIHFVTCSSCTIEIQFRFLNISRNCGKSTDFDSCGGCDYVQIYEPPYEQASGEQFCGRFIKTNVSTLDYSSRTRNVVIAFRHSHNYGHAFTLDYSTERNRIFRRGFPKFGHSNDANQTISSPFFPNFYPNDLSMEYTIYCESLEACRISLIFTDYHLSDASILEFFDWTGTRIYVTSGNIFRPPVIISSGPSLVIRFYANGASNIGYKAAYSFILGDLNDSQFKPDIGGGITMMNMIEVGTKMFNCIWLIKPPGSFFHMKTHLYVKVITFSDFAGSTELTIHPGMTSSGPAIEVLRPPLARFYAATENDHVVPINQGFYISFRGLFRPESRLAIVYAAFNYKDCFAGSDFLCHNLRCISILLYCDGFDHCGDNSDEATTCSDDPRDHRSWAKAPNFLFPKIDGVSDLTTATIIFVLCSFGLVGLIFVMAVLLYRIHLRTRHQQQIHDHIETIHAILEESIGGVEEEIIIPDDPPDYEAPPDYDDVVKISRNVKKMRRRCSRCDFQQRPSGSQSNAAATSRGCQTTPVPNKIPDSPPPAYDVLNRPGPSRGQDLQSSSMSTRDFARIFRMIKARRLWNFGSGVVKFYSDSNLSCLALENKNSFPRMKPAKLKFSDIRKSFSNDDIVSIL